jgi:signal transduction histidine kinase
LPAQLGGPGLALLLVASSSPLLFLLLRRHLSELERAQRALQQSRQRFASFMEQLPMAAFVEDATGACVYANKFYSTRFGTDLIWPAADRQGVLDGQSETERSVELRLDDRSTFWLVRRFAIPAPDGSRRLVGGLALDVTEHYQDQARRQESTKMQALGLMAGGIAHDFNNLLTIINGYAELLDGLENAPASTRHATREIRNAGDHAALLTSRLLAFSRGQMAQPEAIDPVRLIRDCLSIFRDLLGNDVELKTTLPERLPAIWMDRCQLEQVLMNLLVNARDAVAAGGRIELSVTDAGQLEGEPDLNAGHYLIFRVADSGHGMDEATLGRVFEPFFTTKRRGRGTGLGLSIVYGIVSHGGGTIRVDSHPGEGARFSVYLPVASEVA